MAAYSVDLPLKSIMTQLSMYAIGSTLLHSAACVINDICDVDFDRQVERTKSRPLPAGIISIREATTFLIVLTVAATSMLLLTSPTAGLVGLLGIFPLHALYPLMKRWTWWPQAWLGLAMNWGYPVAWLSITTLNLPVVATFFCGTICWSIFYDTIYACQDREDDVKAGVGSTAVLFGSWIRPILTGFATTFIACVVYAGMLNGQGLAYYVVSCGGGAIHMCWQLLSWDMKLPSSCLAKFRSNGDLGYILLAGMLLDCYIRRQ
ncbi:hypothetical protein SERLADRAFT_479380 [Serpula lacrymans var. lacrymans S7.9]|nr:uncharacterized protein SERLADRAFT_479380 [Serpula lacrymans var. lacrymans S7.9]EGO19684.1 hypothetical protein SERLADRAFT_479380 [Serpula lacrymans var. lacrymans S7.9]